MDWNQFWEGKVTVRITLGINFRLSSQESCFWGDEARRPQPHKGLGEELFRKGIRGWEALSQERAWLVLGAEQVSRYLTVNEEGGWDAAGGVMGQVRKVSVKSLDLFLGAVMVFKGRKEKPVASSSDWAFERLILATLWRKDWRQAQVNVGEVSRWLQKSRHKWFCNWLSLLCWK